MGKKVPGPLPPWASATIEPKRSFKFVLSIGGVPAWVVKDAARPEITVGAEATHRFISHQFKFPGRVSWGDVAVTLVDPIDYEIGSMLFDIVKDAGYDLPNNWTEENEGWKRSLSKKRFMGFETGGNPIENKLGEVSIKTLDTDGKEVETWTLKNTWVKKIAYGKFDYGTDALVNIAVTFAYDYATQKLAG